jgi:hypothetical protein
MLKTFEEWRDQQIKKHGPSFGGPFEGWHARDTYIADLEAQLAALEGIDQACDAANKHVLLLQADVAALQSRIDAGTALVEAARFLANEVAASTGMEEVEMRHLLGNTNFNCLIRRMEEVRELLAAPDPNGAKEGE